MIAFFRLMFMLLIVLTFVYVGVSIYSRRVRRGKLETYWDTKGHTGNREAFVQRGLKKYDNSFRRKLILGVYVVPFVVIATLVYVTNYM